MFVLVSGAAVHAYRLRAGPLIFIEVRHSDYFGEDDICAPHDDFGRAGSPPESVLRL